MQLSNAQINNLRVNIEWKMSISKRLRKGGDVSPVIKPMDVGVYFYHSENQKYCK
jgi:hypothetical protein